MVCGDASFAVHPDLNIRTGAIMTMVQGVMQSVSRKQKLSTRSSTKTGLVDIDDASFYIFWRCYLFNGKGTILTRKYFIKTARL